MGFDIADWTTHTGAMYMGAGTSWEVIWTLISAAICVLALVIGSRQTSPDQRYRWFHEP